jgi:hypothetical protein
MVAMTLQIYRTIRCNFQCCIHLHQHRRYQFKAYSSFVGEVDAHLQCYDTCVVPPDDEDPATETAPGNTGVPSEGNLNNDDTRSPEGANLIDFDSLLAAPPIVKRDDLELENA